MKKTLAVLLEKRRLNYLEKGKGNEVQENEKEKDEIMNEDLNLEMVVELHKHTNQMI